jgi:endo-1,4-beta-xylanase
MKRIIFIYIPILFALISASCDTEEFNSDNSTSEPPIANIANLKQASYPVGAAININTLKNNAEYRNIVIKEMGSLTGENAMKMNTISKGRKQYNFDDADYLVNFAQENNMRVHGHTLIWYKHTPDWVSTFSGTTEDWKTIMKEYIQDVVGRYKGKVASWDVVNEIINDDGTLRDCIWLQKIGPEYIELAFQYAYEADPDAILFYNDYGHEYSHTRRYTVNHIADSLAQKGVPIHGIGLQMHTNVNRSTDDLRYAIIAAAKTNLKVHVSEFDVAVNPDKKEDVTYTDELATRQKESYYAAFKAIKDLPENQRWGITMWGVHDPSSWLISNPDWPLPFDKNYERKPAYYGILQGIYRSGDTIMPVFLSIASVNLFTNTQKEVTISGGVAPYTVSGNSNQTVATAVVSGAKLTVTGVTEGTTNITVLGNDGSSATLSVIVTKAVVLITFEQLKANLPLGESVTLPDDIKIKGVVISDSESKNIDAKTIVLQEDNGKGGIVAQFIENHSLSGGDEVEITVSKLILARVNGELTLKDIPAGNAGKVGNKTITPRETTVAEIIANKESRTGTLVKLGMGSFTGGNGKYIGTLEYVDATGSIKSAVLERATFANSNYPAQVNNLIGIVRVNNTEIRVDIRNVNDVVSEKGVESLLVDDFENGTVHSRFRGGNASGGGIVEIVDNPFQNGINTSGKVLKITNNFGSQQLNIDITKNNVNPSLNVVNKGYNRFRFKYCTEVIEDRKVMWKHNGNGDQKDIAVQPTTGGKVWSYAEIEMTEGEMNSLDMIQLRLNHKLDGSNGNSTDVIYIDDLEFYNSSLGTPGQ